MTIARRMWLASAALAVLVGAAFVALAFAVNAQRDATEREKHSREVTAAALQLEKLVSDVETSFLGLTVTRRPAFLEPYQAATRELPERLESLLVLAADVPEQLRRAQALVTRIRQYVDDFVTPILPLLREAPGIADDRALASEGRRYTDDIRRRFDEFQKAEDRLAATAATAAERRTDVAAAVGLVAALASTTLIVLFGFVLSRSVGRPVRAVATGASRLAAGELGYRLPEQGPGEVGELTRSFNEMAERLEEGRLELQAQNDELRESERMKTELVSIVSHELRTPLASVLGFTSLLLKRDFRPDERRHYLGIVDAQARRLAALLEDFLDVQRIEHEGVELTTERIDLARLLDEQAQLYSAQSPKHKLELAVEERPLPVRGDPNRLAQVVGNLLSNAIKYSPEGGTVELGAARSGDGVRVVVRDEGRGIPRDQQDRIFTKFFRGDAGATGITGTGLGLAVSREIVEAHGGRIGFDSEPGAGTTFWLELPAGLIDAMTTRRET